MKIPGVPQRLNKYILLLAALDILSFVLVYFGFQSGNIYILILIIGVVIAGALLGRKYLKRRSKHASSDKEE